MEQKPIANGSEESAFGKAGPAFRNVPQASESLGNIPNDSANFGNVPNSSERFRNLPNDSEPFGNVRNSSVRKDGHTITTKEAARLFEAAGVARTERSITNWCQPNRMGIARLDAY